MHFSVSYFNKAYKICLGFTMCVITFNFTANFEKIYKMHNIYYMEKLSTVIRQKNIIYLGKYMYLNLHLLRGLMILDFVCLRPNTYVFIIIFLFLLVLIKCIFNYQK